MIVVADIFNQALQIKTIRTCRIFDVIYGMIPFLTEEDPKRTKLPVVMVFVGIVEILINGFFVFSGFEYGLDWVLLWSLHGIVVVAYGLCLVQVKRKKGLINRNQIIFGELLLWLLLAIFGYLMYSLRGITNLG